MENNLERDVKRLTNHTPEFRMRAGNYRALFEIERKLSFIESCTGKKFTETI